MGKKPKFTKEQIEKRKQAFNRFNRNDIGRAKERMEDPTARHKRDENAPSRA